MSIFLFQFDVVPTGTDFILNEGIAHDMYPDLEQKMRPLVVSTCEVLGRYKIFSNQNPILQCGISDAGKVEVNLSPGLGKYIDPPIKEYIFEKAQQISDLLIEVMNRRTLEEKETKQEPAWQPIRNLPLIANLLDGQFETANEQYTNLLQAKTKPHVLDDHTVHRVIHLYTDELELIPVFEKQLVKWQKEDRLTSKQQREINRLQRQMKQWNQVVVDILVLARELEKGTIDKILAKSDLELGLESLLKKKQL